MGAWGARWLEIEPRHIDLEYVLWATCRSVDLDEVPAEGVVVRFDVSKKPRRRFWMVLRQPRAEVCNTNPGSLEDLIVTVKAETLIEWNLRRVTFDELVGTGRIVLEGPPRLAKAFPTWLRPSPFADQPATR